jgi:hypothetical protein
MMAAALGTDGHGGLRFDIPQTLFDYRANLRAPQSNIWSYSPHPDGKRFLVNVSTAGQGTVNVILHWQMQLGKRSKETGARRIGQRSHCPGKSWCCIESYQAVPLHFAKR